MTAARRSESKEVGTPPSQGTPSPVYTHPDQHSFILQSILDMQKTLGSLERAVDNLAHSSDKQSEKVEAFSERLHHAEKKLYAAGAILVMVSTLLSLFAPKILDVILSALRPRG